MFAQLIADFLNWLNSIVSAAVPVFDIGEYTGAMTGALKGFQDFVMTVNFVVPLPTMAIIMVADLGIRFSKLSLFIINWVVRRIADIIP